MESGDSKTQEILLEVLPHRSGYFRGKGTAIPAYTKGRNQLHQKVIEKQQAKIQDQDQRIKELEESREQQNKAFAEQQQAFDEFRQQMLAEMASLKSRLNQSDNGY